MACGVDATSGLNLDSVTQSYIAWAEEVEVGGLCR